MYRYNLRGRVDRVVERAIDQIYTAIESLSTQAAKAPSQEINQVSIERAVNNALLGPFGQKLLGDNSAIDPEISSLQPGGGTVTSIATGTGLTGGPISSSGTISLANTAVVAGSYTNTDLTVDAQGRITAASNGSASGSSLSIVTKTANFSISDADDVVLVDTSGGAVTITLHDPSTAEQKLYTVKLIVAGNNLTIATAAGTIDGAATQVTGTVYTSYTVIPVNASGKWYIV